MNESETSKTKNNSCMITNRIKCLLLGLCMACGVTTTLTSCSDNEEGMGTPEILSVRATDPALADSTFTKASTGQMIAVIGRNLKDVVKVYINDQEIGFNSTLNTAHSIILTVPTEENGFRLSAFDSTLKDEIRLETTHGTATYAFKITAPTPQLTLLQARYPRKVGDQLNVLGLNLVDIEKVYFTSLTAEQLDTTTWTAVGGTHTDVTYQVVSQDHKLNRNDTYETTSLLSLTIPDLGYDTGSLVVETAAGTAYYPFSFYLAPPTITNLNTDMPVIGETLTISGTYFVQVDAVRYGDVTLSADEYTIADTEDEMNIVFRRKPSQGSDPHLTIVTGGGEVSVPFYDYSTLLADFERDDAGNFLRGANNGWGPDASFETTDGTAVPYTADGVFARINVPAEGQQWWGTMVYFRAGWGVSGYTLPSFDVIPATASADEVYLAVEVYNNNSDYNAAEGGFMGYIRYMIQPSDDSENQYDNGYTWAENLYDELALFDRPILADIDGRTPQRQWYRHVLPLSSFDCYKGKTYADIVATGLNQFRLQSINQGTKTGKIDVCLDNVRLYYHKK